MGRKIIGVIFFIAWLVCGCSVESFFDGAAPITILAIFVAMACAAIMGGHNDSDY